MSNGDNKCAACGQWAGRGHRCPTPISTPAASRVELPGSATETSSRDDVNDRVSRANAALAVQPDRSAAFHAPSTAEEARGNTLLAVERNGYDDSDFSGLFYDPASGKFGWATTASTSYGGGFMPHPDASEELVARYRAEYEQAKAQLDSDLHEWNARVPRNGATVKVNEMTAGGKRKRKHGGEEGTVIWYGRSQHTSSEGLDRYRVGIEPADGGEPFFVDADGVQVMHDGEWVEPTGTSHTTPGPGRIGMPGDEAMMWAFAQRYPDPDRVERACQPHRAAV